MMKNTTTMEWIKITDDSTLANKKIRKIGHSKNDWALLLPRLFEAKR